MQVKVNLTIPLLGGIEGTWEPKRAERDAAWELYVELITRISVVELSPEDGKTREALTSFYQLFGITRDILRRYGPAVARGNSRRITFGRIAVAMLNGVIRPVLARWHPMLTAHEEARPRNVDTVTHERNWERFAELRTDIDGARQLLTEIAELLGTVAGVESLLPRDLPPRGVPLPRSSEGRNER